MVTAHALTSLRKTLLGCALLCTALCTPAADALPEVIARLKPSVLAIGFYKETQNPRFAFSGTGFVVGNGRWLVTNAHVITHPSDDDAHDSNLTAFVPGLQAPENIRRLEVIDIDPAHDLALLRMDGHALPALALGAPSSAVREGQNVAFIGFPLGNNLGLAPVTHRGIVSAITSVALPSPTARQLDSRAIKALKEGVFELLQLDATAYPGNSGGPVFDPDSGLLLGVMSMVALKGTRESALSQPSGISYAIPAEHVARLLARQKRD